ncbi:MAG: amidohydrolase [Ruminococcaceae bacterium]|nr:amidohydrolase [Oscillospiraceae bacterium]
MFIDIHAHCYKKRVPYFMSWHQPEELIADFDRLDIERGCLLPVVSSEVYFPQTNEDILDMAEKYPDRFIPCCNVDPRAMSNSPFAPLERPLKYYKERGCKILGEVMPGGMRILDDRVQNLFRAAEEVEIPVIYEGAISLDRSFGLYDDPGLPGLEITLQRFPDLMIFGHGPVFWHELAMLETPGERGVARSFLYRGGNFGLPSGPIRAEGVVPKLLRRYPNLMCDLSDGTPANMFSRDEDFAIAFLNEFQDRCCFGTDFCDYRMDVPLIPMLLRWRETGKLSESVFQKIARENAIRLLNL